MKKNGMETGNWDGDFQSDTRSDHTFWLGDDGDDIRMVKGYGFKNYSTNKWGYY